MFSFTGKWICPKEFSELEPLNVFHRERTPNKDYSHPDNLKNIHMLVKKSFDLPENPQKVIVRLTADDYFKLFVNKQFVGQGPTAGYYFCYYYNEFDVTEFLKPGKNEIYLDVYYQGHINRVWGSGDCRMGMIADIIADGKVICSTDNTWEYTISKAMTGECNIGYETQYSEYFDSRVKPGRFVPCFEKQVDYTFADSPSVNLQVYDKKAELTLTNKNGGIFLDFGQEITGTLKITAEGKSGDEIILHYGEELNDDGSVRYEMRCFCRYEDRWILDDGECEFFGYDYKAFRYAEIIPASADIKIKDITAVVRHYPFDDNACTIKSSNEVLDKVFDICKYGVKYASQDVFVDCPSREKGQYAGDLTVTGASHIYLTGDIRLFEKAIINQAQSQIVTDGILAVAPGAFMQEIADYSLQFPILLLRHYMHTGDKDFLASQLPAAEKMLMHFKKFDRGDGMLEQVDTWNLVDWPDNLRDNYDFPLTKPVGPGCHNVINAFYVGSVEQVEKIKDILGVKYENKSSYLKAKFNEIFFDKTTGLYVDSQGSKHSSLHANVIPLYYGLESDANTQSIADFIIDKGLVCGVYMSYFYLKALARAGRYDDVYNTVTSTGSASWYNMVREGGTTCFEAWGKDQKFNTSLCHPWASAPVSVIIEDILGLKCLEPGWKRFTVEPHLPEDVSLEMNIPLITKSITVKAKGNKAEW